MIRIDDLFRLFVLVCVGVGVGAALICMWVGWI